MIILERLHEVLEYDAATGVFSWKKVKGRKAGRAAGTVGNRGYVVIEVDGRKYLAHQLAWLWVTGSWPQGLLDHKDRNRQNNCFENLRRSDKRLNAANTGLRKDNGSGVKGVRWHKQRRVWVAEIRIFGRKKHLGTFGTIEAAAAAYAAAAADTFGDEHG